MPTPTSAAPLEAPVTYQLMASHPCAHCCTRCDAHHSRGSLDHQPARAATVIHTDYYSVELKLPWDEVPPAVAAEAAKHNSWIIEGTRALSVLRHGVQADALVWMSIPKRQLNKGQDAMRKGRETTLRRMVREGFLADLETVYECDALAPGAKSKHLPSSPSPSVEHSLTI